MDFFVGSFFPVTNGSRFETPNLSLNGDPDAMSSVHGASDPTMIATVSEKSVRPTNSVAKKGGRKLPLWMQWRSFWAVSATWSGANSWGPLFFLVEEF